MRLCFDTNIVIDILARADAYPSSYFACDIANLRRFESFIPASSVTDIAYVLHRCGQGSLRIRKSLKKVYELFDIFDVNRSDCVIATDSDMPDIEDAIIATAALRNEIDLIISRDETGFTRSFVPVMTPSDFVKQFCPPNYEYDSIETP